MTLNLTSIVFFFRWNLLDFITNTLYLTTFGLKFISYTIVQSEMKTGNEAFKLNRENWDPWDPTLIRYFFSLSNPLPMTRYIVICKWKYRNYDCNAIHSEGIFAAANIFSCLKLVVVFTFNPQIGPLIISIGKMIRFDIWRFDTFTRSFLTKSN